MPGSAACSELPHDKHWRQGHYNELFLGPVAGLISTIERCILIVR